MTRTGFFILLVLALLPARLLHAQWYKMYEHGREAFAQQNWQEAVNQLSAVLKDFPDSKAQKKMYGLQFSDYFPYLYRGIAYYKLGDMAKARADLENEESKKAIADATDDSDARALLAEYLGYLQKSAAQAPEQKPPPIVQQKPPPQKQAQNPPPVVQQPDTKKLEAAADRKAKREKIEQAMAAGESYFTANDLDRAREQFDGVLALEPSHRRAAEFLKRIENKKSKLAAAAASKQKESAPPVPAPVPGSGKNVSSDTAGSALFDAGVALYNDGKYNQAKQRFQALARTVPSYRDLAKYNGLIEEYERKVQLGISSFFQGDYKVAIEQLKSSSRNGNDNPHVYAFLACSYAAEYLLDGADDGSLKKGAVEAYGRVREINPRYALDTKYISPGIIALLGGE